MGRTLAVFRPSLVVIFLFATLSIYIVASLISSSVSENGPLALSLIIVVVEDSLLSWLTVGLSRVSLDTVRRLPTPPGLMKTPIGEVLRIYLAGLLVLLSFDRGNGSAVTLNFDDQVRDSIPDLGADEVGSSSANFTDGFENSSVWAWSISEHA